MNVSIFSTYAKDRIIGKTGQVSERFGGPLFYLENALKDINVDFDSFHGETLDVEIKLTDKGEVGKLLKFPNRVQLPKDRGSEYIIISTISAEYDLTLFSKFKGKVFVDIQGYVRNGIHMNGKECVYCLKGTKQEISLLPKHLIEDQKKRLLIITDGEDGLSYFLEGKQYNVRIQRKTKCSETIGSGDTLLGYFVGFLAKNETVQNALSLAQRKTIQFLMYKDKEDHEYIN